MQENILTKEETKSMCKMCSKGKLGNRVKKVNYNSFYHDDKIEYNEVDSRPARDNS